MAGTEVAKAAEKKPPVVVEYKPFMSEDTIKLTVAVVASMICVPTKSGQRCNETQALKFMALCKARKLNPFEGDAYLIGYDTKDGPQFSLITAHQAFLKRAEVHPEYNGMKSGTIVKDKKTGDVIDREGDFTFDDDILLGAWATVYFKNRQVPMHKRIKLTTFKKSYGRWNDDPAGMLVKCAEADALRSSFPTQLGGMYLEDEMNPQKGDVADYVPQDRISARTIPISRALENKEPSPPAPETEVETSGLEPGETVDDQGEIHDEPADEAPQESPEEASQEPPPWRELALETIAEAIGPTTTKALKARKIKTLGDLATLLDDETRRKAALSEAEANKCQAALQAVYEAQMA